MSLQNPQDWVFLCQSLLCFYSAWVQLWNFLHRFLALSVELARLCLLQNPTERRLTSPGLEQRERPAAELGLARPGAPSQTWFLPEATVWPDGCFLARETSAFGRQDWHSSTRKIAARSARRAEQFRPRDDKSPTQKALLGQDFSALSRAFSRAFVVEKLHHEKHQ